MVVFELFFILSTLTLMKADGNVVTFNQDYYNESLVAVAVIYRHGDRSPEVSFPNDPYLNKSYWPMGFGQLTKAGINRHFKLGQWFRQRYSTFLSNVYSPNDIYVFSTDSERSLMSAAANLAGLYPPLGFQVWNEKIPWQPIPIHSEKRIKDDIITDKRSCRRFSKAYKQIKKKRYADLEKEYSEILDYIRDNARWENMSLDDISELHRTLYAYQMYNESFLPEWAKYMNQSALNFLSAAVTATPTYTTLLARLRIGPFFSYLFQHFDKFVGPSSGSKPKFLMISAHDKNVTSVLGGMNAFDFRPVKFADAIIWELKKSHDGSYFINVLYKRGEKLEHLKINNCEFNCDYDSFKNSMSNVTVSIQQWEKECDNKNCL